MFTQNNGKTGVILMTYGSATTAGNVKKYFERMYQGKASAVLIEDFENRYRLVGRSPLVEITEKQAALLEEKLGDTYVVRAGMRHSAPFIEDAVDECCAAGAVSLVGIVLSPQFSPFIMEGYARDFRAAAGARHVKDALVAGPWPAEEHFIKLLAKRINDRLGILGTDTPVIFTTHSLPQRVVARDPSYLGQLQKTVNAIREHLDSRVGWYHGYQSAGHTPEEWLKPDLVDILAELQKKNTKTVLVVPIQFLTDHLEVLYDLDIAARGQCEEFAIAYNRIDLPNTDPLFIKTLVSILYGTVNYL